jgi:hypothetical protein
VVQKRSRNDLRRGATGRSGRKVDFPRSTLTALGRLQCLLVIRPEIVEEPWATSK